MDWNWLHSLAYGFLSGLTEILPVSSFAHQRLFLVLTGTDGVHLIFRLVSHLGVIAALIYNCRQSLSRLRRSRAAVRSVRGRKRPLDMRSVYDARVLRLVVLLTLASFFAYIPAMQLAAPLWVVSLMLLANGIILYVPEHLPSGNKDSRNMSGLDSFLMGLGGALAVFPGISRMGAVVSFGSGRGVEKKNALEFALLICIVTLAVTLGFDVYEVALANVFRLSMFLHYILAAAAAFGSAHIAITFMRYLAVKVGYSGFGYYCWGAALFLFIVYLTT